MRQKKKDSNVLPYLQRIASNTAPNLNKNAIHHPKDESPTHSLEKKHGKNIFNGFLNYDSAEGKDTGSTKKKKISFDGVDLPAKFKTDLYSSFYPLANSGDIKEEKKLL